MFEFERDTWVLCKTVYVYRTSANKAGRGTGILDKNLVTVSNENVVQYILIELRGECSCITVKSDCVY